MVPRQITTTRSDDLAAFEAAGPLLTETEAAARLKWSVKTLQRRRWLGQEPAYVKLGRSVRYQAGVIEALIRAGIRRPEDRVA